MKRTSFFWVLVLEGLVGLHRAIQLQLLQCYLLGLRLGLLWYWMVCLGNEQRSFCPFWDCIQVLQCELFCDYEGYSIFSKAVLPTVVDIMVIWVNSPIPVHFSSLIPKMLLFTLGISYLTTSNLPWLMDLTFQVPKQFCSLQHWTLLPSPVTPTTGHCFAAGFDSNAIFAPFLHFARASPLPLDVRYLFWWDPTFSCRWFFSSKL